MGHSAFPLEWPAGKTQRESWNRKTSRFRDLGFGKTRDDLIQACKRLGCEDVTFSTMVPLKRDGLPYANMAQPSNPGVALYFDLPGEWDPKKGRTSKNHYALSCDQYRKVEENMRALVHTLDAMGAIRRHGSSDLLEQAMSGFAALPEARRPDWRQALELAGLAVTFDDAKAAYRRLALEHHPDRGGDPARMEMLNLALADAEHELGGRR